MIIDDIDIVKQAWFGGKQYQKRARVGINIIAHIFAP